MPIVVVSMLGPAARGWAQGVIIVRRRRKEEGLRSRGWSMGDTAEAPAAALCHVTDEGPTEDLLGSGEWFLTSRFPGRRRRRRDRGSDGPVKRRDGGLQMTGEGVQGIHDGDLVSVLPTANFEPPAVEEGNGPIRSFGKEICHPEEAIGIGKP